MRSLLHPFTLHANHVLLHQPSDIAAITAQGVDGIITDNPIGVLAQLSTMNNSPAAADVQMTRGALAAVVIFTFLAAFAAGVLALVVRRRMAASKTGYDTL